MLKVYSKYTSHTVFSVREGSLNFLILFLFSVLVRQKVTINENVSFIDYMSGIRLPDRFKLSINQKNCPNFFDVFCYFDVILFHVNIITGSGLMTIFF